MQIFDKIYFTRCYDYDNDSRKDSVSMSWKHSYVFSPTQRQPFFLSPVSCLVGVGDSFFY
jgi:hypothetical protein